MDDMQARLDKDLSEHSLTLIQEGPCTAYRMGKRGTRIMSTLLVFTPEGITLMGDLTPERNGSVSTPGYGLGWFAGELSGSYVCEKFLAQKYVPALAIEELRDPNSCFREEADAARLKELDEIAGGLDGHGAEWLGDRMTDLGYEIESIPGYGYDPTEADILICIHRAFRRLYAEARRQQETTP